MIWERFQKFAPGTIDCSRSILDGTRPLHTQKEGIEVLGIILAAYESAQNRSIAPVRSTADLVSASSAPEN